MDFDLIVIGAGTAGLSAARTAARRGAATLLVQDGPIGGECTFTGCVPSKALLATAHLPFAAALDAVHRAVATVAAAESADGVTLVDGVAQLVGIGSVTVGRERFRAPATVIATGSSPLVPTLDGLADTPYLTSETVFDLTDRPDSLVIVGGGATGCELAQAFSAFGTAVTVVEAQDRLLPRESASASRVVAGEFTRRSITVLTGRRAVAARPGQVRLDDGAIVTAGRILLCAGRRPRLPAGGMGVDAAGHPRLSPHLATDLRGVYAAGDVTGLAGSTAAADEMGRIAATNALSGRDRLAFDPAAIPHVIFTDPEVARVGAATGERTATVSMAEVDRAVAAGRTEGFVTLVAGRDGKLTGATVVAPHAGEMIQEPALAIRAGIFAGRLAQTGRAYPTWGQAIQLAAARLFTR